MVYSIAVCSTDRLDQLLETLKVADSKELTEEQRETIFEKANDVERRDYFGYALRILSPQYISASMLRRIKFNLNEVSHETAMKLIELCLQCGIQVDGVYVDTVGPPESYQEKLSRKFPKLKIVVSKKADSLFPIVSAASICAKVTRDRAVVGWQFKEGLHVVKMVETGGVGSGYPGDPTTKEFLQKNIQSVFGFPTIVRFSWSTAVEIILKRCVKVHWEDDNTKPEAVGTKSILSFFTKTKRPAPGQVSGTDDKKSKTEVSGTTFFDELSLRGVDNF